MKEEDKTLLVRDSIFNAILNGKYDIGGKLPTEREISEQLEVSRVTARRAYSILEEAGILQRRQGRGTYVADAGCQGNSEHIDQVAFLTAIKDPFAMEFLESLQQELDSRDALCILKITEQDPEKEEKAAIRLVSKGIKNMVIWPSRNFHCGTFARLRLLGTNMVFFDRMLPGEYADYVGLDNDDAVKSLVDDAARCGARALVFVSHSGLDADSDKQREAAFVKYAKLAGIAHSIGYVPWQGDVRAAAALQKEQWLAGSGRTAIICVNDLVAVDIKSIVGDNAVVYGIDGLSQALAAGITTIKQPFAEMAKKCIELLCRQQKLSQNWNSRKVVIKGELITGAVR